MSGSKRNSRSGSKSPRQRSTSPAPSGNATQSTTNNPTNTTANLAKNKQHGNTSSPGAPNQANIVILSSPAPLEVTTHLPQLGQGQFTTALEAFDKLRENDANLSLKEWAEALKLWIDGVFADPQVLAYASAQPQLFVELVRTSRNLIVDPSLGAKEGFTDTWLNDNLAKLDVPGAAAVASHLVATRWTFPRLVGKELRAWILRALGGKALSNAEDGLCARYLNMLWNDGDYTAICDLINDGIDTAKPAYYGLDDAPSNEGLWSGYIQPIEHLLGYYLRLVSLRPDKLKTDPEVINELIFLGRKSPGSGSLTPDKLRDLGEQKVAGARQILEALIAKKSAKVLTSYSDVEGSDLVTAFRSRAGTIWGFEHVRLPYVQAAHETPDGNQPIRMWELWEVVGQATKRVPYEELMANPDKKIPELVEEGVKALNALYANRPAEYSWWKLADFEAAFRKQCTEYLWSLSEQAPRAKYATAAKRGHDVGAYLGSFGCNAGLWWAEKHGATIYYCLDGVKDEDVIDYKKLKTSRINTFLTVKDAKPYVEGITMSEIREILTRWPDLRRTVRFTRMGKFVDEKEILALKTKMEEADAQVKGTRHVPTNVPEFSAVITKLDPNLLPNLNDEEIMRIVAQVQMLETAGSAKSNKVLRAFLATKGCRVLFEKGILPQGFDTRYAAMLDEKNADRKKRLGAELIEHIKDTSTGPARVCDYLRGSLIHAIKLHSGA